VRNIEHLYEKGIAEGSDHALMVVDLELATRQGKEEETDHVCVGTASGI
jgi:hypothetical protein